MKIAEDGEILVKGPNIFQGYYKNAGGDRARRSSTAGCTPATSASIDADGYLKITGRKKDIIITAGGKNITPANLEARDQAAPAGLASAW